MYTAQKFLSNIKTYPNCLGQGAFGIVLKGIDESGSPSAIKFIFPIGYTDREKLLREYTVTKELQHDNIVQIMGLEEKELTAGDIDKIFKDLPYNERSSAIKLAYVERANANLYKTIQSICIKMELCGSNLRQWLNEKHQQTELHIQIRQTRIVQGILAGLNYLHGHKIIHRDLKPENIMFSRGRYQFPVKIGDFGHSRVIHSEDTQTGSLTSGVGTRSYMAPEVSSGEYGQQADLYSLGLIIFEIAQHIEEEKRRNLFDRLVNDREEDLVEDHPIMVGIKEIIIKLTKRKTADRTKSLDQVNTDPWEAALVQEVTRKGCKPLWDAITSNSANNWIAKTSQEFKLCLDNAKEGWVINLADGEYTGGGLSLWENCVEIVGMGAGTVLRVDPYQNDFLVVFGSQCTISGAKIILDNPQSTPYSGGSGLNVDTIKNVKISPSGEYAGIRIKGSESTVSHLFMQNLQRWGILVERNSNFNTISNITGVDLGAGILVFGSNNSLSQIKLEKRIHESGGDGVWLVPLGSFNTISKLTCSGYFNRETDDWDLRISSPNFTVKDSQCGSVIVRGNDAALTNVNCGELIWISSQADGVKLVKCRGKELDAWEDVGVIDCQFKSLHTTQ